MPHSIKNKFVNKYVVCCTSFLEALRWPCDLNCSGNSSFDRVVFSSFGRQRCCGCLLLRLLLIYDNALAGWKLWRLSHCDRKTYYAMTNARLARFVCTCPALSSSSVGGQRVDVDDNDDSADKTRAENGDNAIGILYNMRYLIGGIYCGMNVSASSSAWSTSLVS